MANSAKNLFMPCFWICSSSKTLLFYYAKAAAEATLTFTLILPTENIGCFSTTSVSVSSRFFDRDRNSIRPPSIPFVMLCALALYCPVVLCYWTPSLFLLLKLRWFLFMLLGPSLMLTGEVPLGPSFCSFSIFSMYSCFCSISFWSTFRI